MLSSNDQLSANAARTIYDRFFKYLEKNRIPARNVKREIGITKNQVYCLKDTIKTDPISENARQILIKANNWIERNSRQQNVLHNTTCVETSVVKEIIQVVGIVRDTLGIGVIYGPSHIGKTFALKSIADNDQLGNPVYFRVSDARCRAPAVCRQISRHFGVRTKGSYDATYQKLVDRLVDTRHILVFDEAERLHYRALEGLRDLHDETGCGIILCGKPKIYDMLRFRDVGDFREVMDQLASRVTIMRDLTERTRREHNPEPLFTADDIKALIGAAQLEFKVTAGGVRWLQTRASTLALGGIGKTLTYLYLASRYVSGSKNLDAIDENVLSEIERHLIGPEDAEFVGDYVAKDECHAIPRIAAG